MREKVMVTGHRSPDADSVCSALGYAFFKNRTDSTRVYVAVRGRRAERRNAFCFWTVWFHFNSAAPASFVTASPGCAAETAGDRPRRWARRRFS